MRLLALSSHADTLNSVRPEAELFIGLAHAGVQVTIMTQADSPYAERMQAAGVSLLEQRIHKKFSWRTVRELRSLIRAHRYDVVYAFNNNAICNAAFACLGLPTVLLAYRGQTGNIHALDPAAYLTLLHPRVDGIVCVASAVARGLQPHVRKKALHTVYKGHSLEWYQDSATPRAALGLDDSDFVVG
ncbi:MAG: glycosyltransferase family 4 protein, partial [Pseudomonadota bacterium]